MLKAYLAGPISGLSYDAAEDWRRRARAGLAPEIAAYSPLRAQAPVLRDQGRLQGSYEENVLTSARGILARDHWDCRTADLVLVNLLGAATVSIGTVLEIAWAHAYGKPLVVAIEPGNCHQHPMLSRLIDYPVASLSEAVAVARAILLP